MITYHRVLAVPLMAGDIQHAQATFTAAETAELPLPAACALLEKETGGGANVWGHDPGGVFCGLPGVVTEQLFVAFLWEIRHNGRRSNGVGPTQITYAGHFDVMEKRGLRPWIPMDNMIYGFELLRSEWESHSHDWVAAGTAYNGAAAYGVDLEKRVQLWRDRLRPARVAR